MKSCEYAVSSSTSSYGAMLLSPSSGEGGGGGGGSGVGSPPSIAGCISSNGSSSNSIEAPLLSATTRGMPQQHQQQQQEQEQLQLQQQQATPQELRRSSSPNSFMMIPQQHHNPLATPSSSPPSYPSNNTHVVGSSIHHNFPQPHYNVSSDNGDLDPLSYILACGQNDKDPFRFGLGSVDDGTFGGHKPTPEQLLLFRSHRLLQAEAVGVAIGGLSLSAAAASGSPDATAHMPNKRFGLICAALSRQIRIKVLEQTNAAVDRVHALGDDAPHSQQQEVIDMERRNCHRMLAGILDAATSTLREIVTTSCGGGGGLGGGAAAGMVGTVGPGPALPSSLLNSPVTESQQVKDWLHAHTHIDAINATPRYSRSRIREFGSLACITPVLDAIHRLLYR